MCMIYGMVWYHNIVMMGALPCCSNQTVEERASCSCCLSFLYKFLRFEMQNSLQFIGVWYKINTFGQVFSSNFLASCYLLYKAQLFQGHYGCVFLPFNVNWLKHKVTKTPLKFSKLEYLIWSVFSSGFRFLTAVLLVCRAIVGFLLLTSNKMVHFCVITISTLN